MNPLLQAIAGLVLASSAGTASISIEGAISKPGEFITSEPIKLRTLMRKAGVRDDADRKRVQIRSESGSVTVVDATRIEKNPLVRPGDVVNVPIADMATHVIITGGVQSRGAIEIRPGLDLTTALAEAGMPTGVGRDRVTLTRMDNGKTETTTYDLDKIQSGLQANVLLRPGDKVAVPYMRASSPSDRDLLTIVVVGLLILLILK